MERRQRTVILMLALLALATVAATGCKSSGIAVTAKGQALHLDVELPQELAEGESADLRINLSNRGVNNIGNIVVEVEIPNELLVLSESHEGTQMTEERTPSGIHRYYYHITELNIGKDAGIAYRVQARFGTALRSGDIKATAYQKDLPGDKLIETKAVSVKR